MNNSRCAEIRQYIGPYVDGEFDERDAALFEEHLGNCAECRAYFEEQTWMMSALKPVLRRPIRMPNRAKQKLEAQLRQAQRPEQARRFIRYITHPVPVALVAMGVLFVVKPGFQADVTELSSDRQTEEVAIKVEAPVTRVKNSVQGVSEAIDQHVQALPIERPTPEHSDVERWFASKLPFNVNALRFRDHRVNLLGGRISRFRGTDRGASQPAARLFYQVGGHKMSVLVMKDEHSFRGQPSLPGTSQPIEIVNMGRHRVATVRRDGLTYLLTSELGPDEMRTVIESAR